MRINDLKIVLNVRLAVGTLVLLVSCSVSGDYIARGNLLQGDGKYADAVLEYRKAIQKDGSSVEAHYRLGLTELQQKHYQAAYAALGVAVKMQPDRMDAAVKLADVALGLYLGDPAKPKAIYDQLVNLAAVIDAKQPQSAEALRLKAYIALLNRRNSEAINLFQKADSTKPYQPDVVEALMRVLIEEKRYPESETAGLRYLEKDKTNGPIWDLLYILYTKTARLEDAEKVLLRKAQQNPERSDFVIQLASYYQRAGKSDQVALVLQPLLNEKKFPQGAKSIGQFYESTGQLDLAARHYESAASSQPGKKTEYLLRAGIVLYRQGKTEKATSYLQELISKQPDNYEALAALAAMRVDGGVPGDVEKAVLDLKSLSKRKPEDTAVGFVLARGLVLQGELEEARILLEGVLRTNPNDYEARLLLTQLLVKMNRSVQALESADRLLDSQPANVGGQYLRGVALLGLDRAVEGEAALSKLVAQFPNFREAWLQLGLIKVVQKKFKEADNIFQRLGTMENVGKEDSRSVRGLALSQLGQGRGTEALGLLTKELEKSPKSVELRETIARTALGLGRFEVAMEQYKYLSAADPRNSRFEFGQGIVLQRSGDAEKAIVHFEKAAMLSPKSADPLLQIGLTHLNLGKTAAAVTAYRQGLARQPDNATVWNDLAYALAESGSDLDEALRLALQAQQKFPGSTAVADTVGWVYLKKKMTANALNKFVANVNKEPENPSFRFHLGVAFAANGEKEKAREALQKALKNNPSQDIDKKIRVELSQL